MNKIDRYLGKAIIAATAIVLLVLLGVQSFIQLAAQLRDVGKGDYAFVQAALFVPLMLPSDLYQLFPMAALIGSLLGLGRLSDSSELVVMRTSGLSLWRIAKIVLLAACLMLVVVTVIGEVVAPRARNVALTMKRTALTQGQMLQTGQGVWLKDHNRFLHVARIDDRRHLSNISLYEFDQEHHLVKSRAAQSAHWDGTQRQWVFNDVRMSTITPERIIPVQAEHQSWPVRIDAKLLTLSKIDPNQQTLGQLHRYLKFREHSGFGQGAYAFVFWKRIFQPLATLVMILLAIPFIFGPMSRTTKGARMVVGILAGFAFYIMNQFFGPMSQVYQIPPMFAALLPSFLCAGLGAVLLRRAT